MQGTLEAIRRVSRREGIRNVGQKDTTETISTSTDRRSLKHPLERVIASETSSETANINRIETLECPRNLFRRCSLIINRFPTVWRSSFVPFLNSCSLARWRCIHGDESSARRAKKFANVARCSIFVPFGHRIYLPPEIERPENGDTRRGKRKVVTHRTVNKAAIPRELGSAGNLPVQKNSPRCRWYRCTTGASVDAPEA